MLNQFVTYQGTTPVGLVAITSTYTDILLMDITARTERAPSPYITISTIGGSLTSIECTAVEYTLMAIIWPLWPIV